MTKEDIQKVLELALEYYKLEVFGTGKESENPNQERIDWIYDRMKEKQVNRPKSSDSSLEDEMINYWGRIPDDKDLSDTARHFALWQKEQDRSRKEANIKLANTDVPVDFDMEIAFHDIWEDVEVIIERDGKLDTKLTEDMKALCHDFFESGKEWHKEQMMKEAVEGYVNYYEDYGGILMAEAQVGYPYHNGEKVHIIIVKEDNQ